MMPRFFLTPLALVLALTGLGFLVIGHGNTVLAAKPQPVIDWSNGFPSGPHFNLNIHGKKDDYNCDPSSGGGSVFVPEYGYSEIDYIQNKKSSVSELTVLDKCGDAFDGDPAAVQLPSGEYQVYARILAKPKKNDEPRDITFYPKLVEACNDVTVYDLNGDGVIDIEDLYLVDVNGDGAVDGVGVVPNEHDLNGDGVVDDEDVSMWLSAFGELTECVDSDLLGIGMITGSGAFLQDGQSLERETGKSKAIDITQMFMWVGIAFDTSLDLNGDGNLTMEDFLLTDINGDGVVDDAEHDLNGDLVVDDLDFNQWIAQLEASGSYKDFTGDPVWVFDIADLVVYGWDYENNGSKLVQIRFYPVATTEFVE